MRLKSLFFLVVFFFSISTLKGQILYGTTGLVHAPTADMQRDKTVLFGASFLNKNSLPGKWRLNSYTYNTFNYYINITIFPWLEVGYDLMLNKGIPNSTYWPKQTWEKFVNQDRSFHARLRLWKEGWWREWTPQIVFGANDPATHTSYGGGGVSLNSDGESGTNNYLTRWYLAATKHVELTGTGEFGIHLAYIWGHARNEPVYKLPSGGFNFQFALPDNGSLGRKVVKGVNLMAEFCPKPMRGTKTKEVVNVGLAYKIWKDHINLMMELNECKYFSGGVYFKIHLK